MSFVSDLRPYFNGRIAAADPEYYEWTTDPFSEDNIPATLLNKAYRLEYGSFTLQKGIGNGAFVYDGPVTIDFLFKGYNTPIDAVDTAWTSAETIIQKCCLHSSRLTQTYIKNVLARDVSVSAFGSTNNSVVRLTIVFDCELILAVS